MKWIAPITLLVIFVAACTTVFFVDALEPTSASAFVLISAWLVLPYLAMSAALAVLWRKGTTSVHWHVAAIAVSVGGVLFLADVIFWHPDAQGAIAVLMIPLVQGGALALLLPVAAWMSRKART
jgi:hypothetical protein